MYLPLTDLLVCPRCGPDHGLILLADEISDRRVLAGALGCPRCRERYPVVEGFVDLRVDPVPAAVEAVAAAEDREAAIRLAALLGLAEGIAYTLLVGPSVVHAPALAELIEGLEVVACSESLRGWGEERGVSRLAAGQLLPFRTYSMGGVAMTGHDSAGLLAEAARVLSPAGRMLWEPVPVDAEARLTGVGLRVVAREGEVLVAARA